MTMLKAITPIAWGGSIQGETLKDVMDRAKRVAPSVAFARYGDVTSGGWPVYEVTVDESEYEALREMFDLRMPVRYKN